MTQPSTRYAPPALGYLAAILTLGIAGCADDGPKLVPVAGKVLVDGQPVTFGSIRFVPSGARPSDARIEADGTFRLRYNNERDGAVLGMHRVEVHGNEILSPSRVKWHAPPSAASIGTSGITQEITGPVEDLVIELKWGSKKGPYELTSASDGGT